MVSLSPLSGRYLLKNDDYDPKINCFPFCYKVLLSVKKSKEMFKKADTDNDDKIDYEEFIKSVEKIINDNRYVGKEFEKFRKAFSEADENDDGLITVDQFRLLSTKYK